VTISDDDQIRFSRQSGFIESGAPLPDGFGAGSLDGPAAAAFGRKLLRDALGSDAAVDEAIRSGRSGEEYWRHLGGSCPTSLG